MVFDRLEGDPGRTSVNEELAGCCETCGDDEIAWRVFSRYAEDAYTADAREIVDTAMGLDWFVGSNEEAAKESAGAFLELLRHGGDGCRRLEM